MRNQLKLALLALCTMIFPAAALEGNKAIVLIDAGGNELEIGRVTFRAQERGIGIDVKLDEGKFTDKFLSMRPFLCIERKKQAMCHLAYPYKTRKTITPDDMTDLEYELLFLHKKSSEYGINPLNGIYYDLTKGKDERIQGVLMEIDMNIIAVPPEKEYARPISSADLFKGDAAKYQFPRLEIR